MPGATALEDAWLAALAGQHGYLAGTDAQVAACDALISPVVIGHPDPAVVDQMIEILLGFLEAAGSGDAEVADTGELEASDTSDGEHDTAGHASRIDSKALSPEAWQALRHAIARLAIDLVSGPDGIASVLRRGLLEQPYNSKSAILDIGYSTSVPPAIRRAVQLRAQGHCEWPGCQRRAAACDVHHLVHKADGGKTSVSGCALLCQYHHDICIHRRGWRLVLHPDATTTAYGPNEQVINSHGPPVGSPAGKTAPPGGQ
jgi:hypothetical protein